MPLPKPEPTEERNEFLQRCMIDETSVEDFPDEKQRIAVCIRQWNEGTQQDEMALNDEVSERVEKSLEAKLKDHREKVGDDKRKQTTLRKLKVVYNRGIGAYKTNPSSVRPSVSSPEQWAQARVNSFLYALRNLRYRSGKHDTDLLPDEHPMATKEEQASAFRNYPDGEAIPESLPDAYRPARSSGETKGQACINCKFFKEDTADHRYYCTKWAAPIRPQYWCAAWAAGQEELAETYNDYPQSATNNAKRALKYKADNPDNDCGTRVGWERANQLASRERISRDTIARMASFKRHQQHKDVPYSEGCGGIVWDAWGGTSGIEWAIRKLEKIDKEAASNMTSEKFAFAARQDEGTRLDKDSGRMLGVALISEGEAKGHELQVDKMSLETVVDAIDETIPAYITHRGAIFDDRLLREIGVFNNIRVEGDRVLGDFEAFESFKEDESRKFNRLFELAEKMPGKFGLSIVFSADKVWATEEGDVPFSFQDKEPPEDAMFEFPSIRVLEVSSADFVDSPAANERGLFSQIDIKPNNKMTKPELQDAFDALSAEKETFESQLSEVQEQLSTAKASIESLCADKEALETELSEKSAKVTELEGLLSEKTEAFEAKETEAAELQTKFDEAESEKVKLSEKVDLLSSLIKGENDAPAAFGDDVTGDEYIPSKEARDKAIEEFAKSKGISLFSATVELSRIRPELFKSE